MSDKYPGNLITGPSSGYSVYFNGVNSYLTFTKNLELTTDFTIEFWLYPVAQSTAGFYFMGSVIGPYIATEALKMLVGQNGAWLINPALPMPSLNRWNHIALVRASNVMRLYINGVSSSPYTTTQSFTGSQTFGIGAENSGASIINKEFFMTSLRVSTIARYSGTSTTSANFGFPSLPLKTDVNTKFLSCQTPTIIDQSASPATITVNGAAAVSDFYLPSNNPGQFNPALGAAAPGIWSLDEAAYYTRNRLWPIYDPKFSNTTLMLHGNGVNAAQNNTFLDSSANNFTITRNGNTTQGTFSPFSQTGWSNYFDGTGDYLNVPSSANLAPGAAFTFECWIYAKAITAEIIIYSATTNGELLVGYQNSTTWGVCSRGVAWRFTSTTLPIPNQWNHIVVSRGGTGTNQTSLFLNGARVANGTVSDAFTTASAYQVGWNGGSGGASWDGYISNLRLVKGADIYGYTNTTITVPTAPLTTIVPSGTVQLLTCQSNSFIDNSANNFTLTSVGNSAAQPFSPFAPQYAYSPAVTGGSGYFDGSGDYLTAPGTTEFAFGTGAWTVQFWVYPFAYGSSAYGPSLFGTTNGATTNYSINLGSTIDNFRVISNASGAWADNVVVNAGGGPPLNVWSHMAIVRDGANLSIYKNGTRVGTTAGAISYNYTGTTGFIGRVSDGSTGIRDLNGYLCNLQVVKGTAVYNPTLTTITVPTAPVTAIANTALLINFTNAGILDSTARNNLETFGNAQVSTAQSKFGGSSMLFDGTGDYLLAPSSTNFDLAAGDFTVEFWVQPTTITGSERGIFGIGTTDPNSNLIRIQASTSKLQFWLGGSNSGGPGAGTKTGIITCTTALVLNAWYHVALVRSGSGTNNVKLYLNGVLDGQGTGTYYIGANPFGLGMGYPGSAIELFIGYIDDFRITKGVARYLANFTPPTSQLQDQ